MIHIAGELPKFEHIAAPPHIFLATPFSGGTLCFEYLNSYTRTCALLGAHRIPVTAGQLSRETSVEFARNRLASQFLETRCTHLMFIDADMEWNPEDVLRLISHKEYLVAGAGPVKSLEPDGMARYCCNLTKDMAQCAGKPLIEALHVGTGFMLIAREVLDMMRERTNVARYDVGNAVPKYEYQFFRRSIEPDGNGRMVNFSEDYAFCNRWRELGGKVWVDTLCQLGHVGRHTYKPESIHTYLTEEPVIAAPMGHYLEEDVA